MTHATPERVLVVVPTYDEIDNLGSAVAGVRAAAPFADLLVVDDNSPDGTGVLADSLSLADGRVHVLHRTEKEGLGAAYREAFAWALDRNYDVIVEMDADGSHDPSELPRLLAGLVDADLVLGSRWIPGGAVQNWPRWRRALSRVGNTYARIALRLPVSDATGGYRAYRAEVLRGLPMCEVSSAGYCFQVDMVHRAVLTGFRVVEVPITFRERTRGYSKMSGHIVTEALVNVTVWAVRDRSSRTSRVAREIVPRPTMPAEPFTSPRR